MKKKKHLQLSRNNFSKKIFSQILPSAVISIFATAAVVLAWTEPTVAPPNGNIAAPVNTGDTTQYKSGALGVGGVLRGYGNGIFDGNVGIGMTGPAYKLVVNGVVSLSGPTSDTSNMELAADVNANYLVIGKSGYWGIRQGTAANSINFDVYNSGTEKAAMTILQNGNVGIGTTGPRSALDVRSTLYLGAPASVNGVINSDDGLYVNIDADNNNADTTSFVIAKNRTDITGGTELFRVQENGNVGIGTADPDKNGLYVLKSIGQDSGKAAIRADAYGSWLSSGTYTYGGYFTAQPNTGQGSVFSYGVAGIANGRGFSPGSNSRAVGGYFSASGADYNYGLIVDQGNVGIGTADPKGTGAKLDVNGSIAIGGQSVIGASGDNIYIGDLANGDGTRSVLNLRAKDRTRVEIKDNEINFYDTVGNLIVIFDEGN